MRQVDSPNTASLLAADMTAREDYRFSNALGPFAALALTLVGSGACFAQADPASEPAVLAVAKVLPAVVNINTERIVRRTVRDPLEDLMRNSLVTTASG